MTKKVIATIFFVFAGCGTEQMSGFDAYGECTGPSCDANQTGEIKDETAWCISYECNRTCVDLGYTSGWCKDSINCECSQSPPPEEVCGDGIDNNGNGGIDEGCSCTAGQSQPCYSGPPDTRNVGVCIEGIQSCEGEMEFLHWGPCRGEVIPSEEYCGDLLDNDCDGQIDELCETQCYVQEFGYETSCSNGQDDDCDGFIDCQDPDCNCCVPMPEICNDGIDNDCDGRRDCWDLMDCMIHPPPEDCFNRLDDDCDRYVDCDDTDCCDVPECYDPNKCGLPCCVPGTWRYCDTPSYCSWGRQECQPDGRWGTCEETTPPPGCDSYYYNRDCCLSQGYCCMNYPYDDTSVGNCSGIAVDC